MEADHIHNLPDLLRNYSEDRLKYYWEVERPSFIDDSANTPFTEFEELWEQLRREAGFPADRVSAASRD